MTEERDDQGVAARPKYRDNDDVRAPLDGDARQGTKPDSRSEARGDSRENVGNNTRGTASNPTGPENNDRTRGRPQRDTYDAALENDSEQD